jgi:hypothetical protein
MTLEVNAHGDRISASGLPAVCRRSAGGGYGAGMAREGLVPASIPYVVFFVVPPA